MRTPTPAQQHYSLPSRPPSSQPGISSHPTPQPQPQHLAPQPQPQPTLQPQPMYQHLIPNQPFATSPLAGARNVISPTKAGTNNTNPAEPPPNPMPIPLQANPQASYSQQLHHVQQLMQQQQQQRMNAAAGGGGRSTPNHPHTHTPSQSQSQSQSQVQTPSPARASPRVINKSVAGAGNARRSPLPPNVQPAAPHPQPLPLPQHQQQQHLAFPAQYNGHLRPGMHGGPSPHPQTMSPHITNPNGNGNGSGMRSTSTSTASPLPTAPDGTLPIQQPQLHLQQQQQLPQMHHGYPQLYNYPQMNFPTHAQAAQAQGRAAAAYWQMSGRPGMMGVGVGVGGQGMMGPGQPVVVGGPGNGGATVPGR
jgi:hypothetical protein